MLSLVLKTWHFNGKNKNLVAFKLIQFGSVNQSTAVILYFTITYFRDLFKILKGAKFSFASIVRDAI